MTPENYREDFQISTHFKFSEFCSNWRHGEIEDNNYKYAHQFLPRGVVLCTTLLESIRRKYMSPITIASGMRYALQHADGSWEGLDYEIRSARAQKSYDGRSQHCRFEACDFHVSSIDDHDVWEWICSNSPHPFGQCIFEVSGQNTWVHLSIPGYRTPDRGGEVIFGECVEARRDALSRWRYTTVDVIDPWGKRKDYETRPDSYYWFPTPE